MKDPADGRLWLIAGGLSLLFNIAIFSLVGLAVIESQRNRKTAAATPEPSERAVWIVPETAPANEAAAPEVSKGRTFARTAEDQAAEKNPAARFIGERDTAAVSERAPVADAPALPSQSGIEPRHEGELETTQSNYRDGELDAPPAAAASPADPAPPAEEMTADAPASPAPPPAPAAAPREQLYEGAAPVEVPVPALDDKTRESTAARPSESAVEESPPQPETTAAEKKPAAKTAPDRPKEKAFQGFQRKTAIVGSISRTGRSSLDVENTALGRYQANISRAVELEWQRNCVRHRDFITPGYLTARFFVDAGGNVKSVQFLGEMQTGEIQKGFTLNSIRDAEIPPMPAGLRKELGGEPLELVFRFFF